MNEGFSVPGKRSRGWQQRASRESRVSLQGPPVSPSTTLQSSDRRDPSVVRCVADRCCGGCHSRRGRGVTVVLVMNHRADVAAADRREAAERRAAEAKASKEKAAEEARQAEEEAVAAELAAAEGYYESCTDQLDPLVNSLLKVDARLGKTFRAYAGTFSDWNDCIFDYGCDTDALTPSRQAEWLKASQAIDKAADFLGSLDPHSASYASSTASEGA